MFPPDKAWQPNLNWETPAGRLLKTFVSKIPEDKKTSVIVIGSAILQLGVGSTLISGGVVFISSDDFTHLIEQEGFGPGRAGGLYLEQCAENIFIASPTWRERAFVEQHKNVDLIFPHPLDILVSKVRRLDEKDLRAFQIVKEATGHPDEEELKAALQNVVDMYRPAFDEENAGGDAFVNTVRLWNELFGKSIDVRKEIIQQAIKKRTAQTSSSSMLKDELRNIN